MLKFLRQSFSTKRHKQTTTDRYRNGNRATPSPTKPDPSLLNVHILLLDGESQSFTLHKKTLGDVLLDKVCFNLELSEKDFFGLQYCDSDNVCHWLEPSKRIKKQVTIGVNNVYTLQFRVKFFPSQPQLVKEELTKYYFYWQLKQDVANGDLPVPGELAVQLAALNVQSELGDFESHEHDIITVSEFRFVPEAIQTAEFERQVMLEWASLGGMNPAQCEDRYINKLKDIEMYGVSMHEVLGKDLNTYKLGLTPFGMLIYDGDERIGLFLWQKMTRLYFNKKQLFIHVAESDPNGDEKLHVFQFTLKSSKVCKHLWKCAIEFHMFYRLQSSNVPELRDRQSFVRMQSKFRYSGRTEAQLRASAKAPQPRRQIQFQRRPSKRYSRRESHRVRERILSQSQNNVASLNSSHNTNPNFAMRPQKGHSGSQVSLVSRPSNHQYNVSSNAINYPGNLDQKHSMTDLELSGHRSAAGYDRTDNLMEFSPSSNESKSLGYASYVGSSIAMNKQSSHGSHLNVDEERGCVEFARTAPKVPERPLTSHYLLTNNESMVSSSNSSGTPQKSSSDGERNVGSNNGRISRNNNYNDQHFDSNNQPVVPPRGKSSRKSRDSSRDRSASRIPRDEFVSSNDNRGQRSQISRPSNLTMDQNEFKTPASYGASGSTDASARYNHHKNLLFDTSDRDGPSFLSSTLITPDDQPGNGHKDTQLRQLPSFTSTKVSRRVMMTEI